MYTLLLVAHSIVRWLVLAALLYTLYRSYRGWFSERTFSKQDRLFQNITTRTVHLQFLLGLVLYVVSPVIQSLFQNFSEAVGQTAIRFFAMEHSVMMLIAVVLITIGSKNTRKKSRDREKFKTLAIWFTIALIVILISIPWPFLGSAGRPLFRLF